ncbi:MAG: aminotransferase class V-fold PLP-dependent enzyme [Planctomycetes bacterium]|nr:aminotransferase class V-fold PLP-dependent enzyme [Planctomycetota bacterium]
MNDDPLLKYRSLFPILEKTTYLVSHSLGAMPRTVYDQMKAYADKWATRGVRAWSEGWWDAPLETGNLLAAIFDAPAGSVIMHQNVSVAESVIASALEFKAPRNKVVYTELNFPTVQYVWEAARRRGAETFSVKSRDGMTIELADMLAAIDERTLLVEISHVLYKSGFLMDAREIIKKARAVGAMVLLDCYQSTGTVPFSVRDLEVDIVVGGSVKWLCGGPGAGYLYVRPDLMQRFEPTVTGWAAHADPFAFETGAIRYAPDARRFLHGSPSVPALYAARAGYEIISEIGVRAIRARSEKLTEWFYDACIEAGFVPTSPRDVRRRGGTVTVSVDREGGPSSPLGLAVKTELERREIIVDFRPGAGIRVSPHFYNTQEELERFIRETQQILASGAWKQHAGKGVVH